MDTTLLTTFMEVTRTRHFAKAADNLCVSPSTISARVRQLEASVGISLLIRNHQQVSLTPAGERMQRHARFILGAWERAYEDIALSESLNKRLVVAGVSSLWDIFLQDWLNGLYLDQPDLGLRAEESTPQRVVEKLGRGLIDVGFMYEPPKLGDIATEPVKQIPLVMVSNLPEQRAEVAIAERYVRVDWGTTFTTLHEQYYVHRPLAPVRVNSGRVGLSLILKCGGAAYLPRQLIAPYLESGQLYLVEDAPMFELQAYAAYSLHGEHKSLIKQLLQRIEVL